MNVLSPFKEIDKINIHEEIVLLNKQIEELKTKKYEKISDYIVSCFKSPKFINKQINRYESNPYDLVCDIVMINMIKQAYNIDSRSEYMTLGTEDYNDCDKKYSYKEEIMPDFKEVTSDIIDLYHDFSSDMSFSDMMTFCIILPTGNYFDMIDTDIEYTEDYHCQDVYMIKPCYYQVALALEKMLLRNKDKYIKMIKKLSN